MFLNPCKGVGDIARKLLAWAAQGQTKTTIDRNQFLRHGYLEMMLVVNSDFGFNYDILTCSLFSVFVELFHSNRARPARKCVLHISNVAHIHTLNTEVPVYLSR